MKQCDAKDGVADGMISDPLGCDFDPAVLACKPGQTDACIAPEKISAIKKAFAGPKNAYGTQVYPGFLYDAGITMKGPVSGLLALGTQRPLRPLYYRDGTRRRQGGTARLRSAGRARVHQSLHVLAQRRQAHLLPRRQRSVVLAARHARLLPITCRNQRRRREGCRMEPLVPRPRHGPLRRRTLLSITSTCSPLSSTGSRRERAPDSVIATGQRSPAAAARSALIQNTRSTTETVTPRTPATSNAKTRRDDRERFAVMSFKYICRAVFAAWLFFATSYGASAQPTPGHATPTSVARPLPFVSPIFGDNMVLQRGKPNTIWGWSDAGDRVRVEIGDKPATAIAGPDRRWQVKIQPPEPGGPYSVKITGHQTVELHNVLVGDVWLCGGQSNMGLRCASLRTQTRKSRRPTIPIFVSLPSTVIPPITTSTSSKAIWRVVTPETAGRVSAVAYYFARKLQHEIHIPIGIVADAVGGTPAESWAREAALRPLHDFDVPLAELDRLKAENAPEYGNYVMHWYDQYDIGHKNNWAASDFDDSNWKQVQVPGGFADVGVPDTPAVVWFRREITLPDPMPKAAPDASAAPGPFPRGGPTLHLGSIERMDTAYVNGVEVGASAWVENPRVYFIRPGSSETRSQRDRDSRSQDQARWRISFQTRDPPTHAL